MALELLNVMRNFEYRLENISLTYTGDRDGNLESANGSSITEMAVKDRMFHIDLDSAVFPDRGASSDGYVRESPASYRVSVYYKAPASTIPTTLYEKIISDQQDILSALEDPAKFDGIVTDTGLDIGLRERKVTQARIVQQQDYWTLQLQCSCLVYVQY